MATFWRYVRVQLFVLLCGIVGPIFLAVYVVAGRDPLMRWLLWVGLLITALDVVIAVAITAFGTRKAAATAALEATGVLALARVTGIHQTNTSINDAPLVRLDLQVSGPGLTPFSSQDRVVATLGRQPMITGRALVALVDPVTGDYEIDWDRSAVVSGMVPATFVMGSDGRTYDLTGQTEPLLEILTVLKSHGIPVAHMLDVRSDPGVRQQIQTIVRRAAARQAAAAATVAPSAPPPPTTSQRLQELETLRATGAVSDAEYTAKRQQIIAEL